jgi:hypothetical protein
MKIIQHDEKVEIEKLGKASNLSEWLNALPVRKLFGDYYAKEAAPRVECKDGTTLSVQASETHYCSPRENNPGFYRTVEVGFPSIAPPETWKDYFDGDWDSEDRTDSVYGYIPIALVEAFIDEHGGCK